MVGRHGDLHDPASLDFGPDVAESDLGEKRSLLHLEPLLVRGLPRGRVRAETPRMKLQPLLLLGQRRLVVRGHPGGRRREDTEDESREDARHEAASLGI